METIIEVPIADKTKTELLDICRSRKIKGFSNKNKEQLIELIMNVQTSVQTPVLTSVVPIDDKISDEMTADIEIAVENIVNGINTENENVFINLYQHNLDTLKATLPDNIVESLRKEYDYKENNERNIYDFIDAYRNAMKQKFNMDMNHTDYELLTRVSKNPENIKVVWGNCLDNLKKMPAESVGHMVTSPPYYNAREYSTWPNLKAYMDNMREIITECYRVLDNHRVFVFNISDIVDNDKMDKINAFGKRKIPLPAYFIVMFEECGFTFVDDIIWDKGEVQSSRHKNGNKPFPFFQYSCNCYEHILIFHKHRLEKNIKYPCNDCGSLIVKSNSYTSKGIRSWECKNPDCKKSESDRGKRFSLKTIVTQNPFRQQENLIPKELVQLWRRDIHKLSPVIKINNKKENKLGHTAPFPIDIPLMSTYYYSYKGDIVLDIFAGSFTTAIAAQKLGRIGVGFELRKDLFKDCILNNLTNKECAYEEVDLQEELA
jgi:DNA modification methylase